MRIYEYFSKMKTKNGKRRRLNCLRRAYRRTPTQEGNEDDDDELYES